MPKPPARLHEITMLHARKPHWFTSEMRVLPEGWDYDACDAAAFCGRLRRFGCLNHGALGTDVISGPGRGEATIEHEPIQLEQVRRDNVKAEIDMARPLRDATN
jgi:hypothetical protein